MDVSTSILFVIVGIVGIVMASIGINFYNKFQRESDLSEANKNILIILLTVFILLIVGVGVNEVRKGNANMPMPGGE